MVPPPPFTLPCGCRRPSSPRHRTAAQRTVGWGEGGAINPPLIRYFFLLFFLFGGPAARSTLLPPPDIPLQFSHFGGWERTREVGIYFSGTLVYLYILIFIMNILRYYYTEKPMRLIKVGTGNLQLGRFNYTYLPNVATVAETGSNNVSQVVWSLYSWWLCINLIQLLNFSAGNCQ